MQGLTLSSSRGSREESRMKEVEEHRKENKIKSKKTLL